MASMTPMSSTLCAASLAIDPPIRIRINAPGVVGLGPLYLSLEQGYFKAENLNVEFASGVAKQGGMQIAAALIAGNLDLATIAPSADLFDALAGGAPLVGVHVLNTVMPSDQSSGIIVRRDHVESGRYKSAKSLKGMQIAIGAIGSSGHYNVVRALAEAGLSAADVNFVTLPFAEALAALGSAAVDAAFEVEPFVSSARTHGIGELVEASSATSPGVPSIMVYGNANYVAEHRVAVERYVYALLRGQRDYHAAVSAGADKAAIDAALMKYTVLRSIAQIEQVDLPTVDPDGAFDSQAMADMQTFFVSTGRQRRPLSTHEIIDSHFTSAAVDRLRQVG